MKNIIVSTSVKTNDILDSRAKDIAKQLDLKFIERKKKTIKQLLEAFNGIVVVYKNKISYFQDNEELFFHLDTTALKIKNNDNEPLIEIIGKNQQSIVDCTMGLAGDSTILSYYGHKVTAIEKNKIIHLITATGLNTFESSDEKINVAMRNIITYNTDSVDFLRNCKDNQYDVVYFDPMFTHNIAESTNLSAIETLAEHTFPIEEFLNEAKRVAKRKIIIKAHFKDDVFEKYSFVRLVRKNTKFHYGYIDL